MVISYPCFGQPINPILRVQESSLTLRMGLIDCPEWSVRNYHHSLCNKPEEPSFHVIAVYYSVLCLPNISDCYCTPILHYTGIQWFKLKASLNRDAE